MSLRVRADQKTILCAAKSNALPDDELYLDDNIHDWLAQYCGLYVDSVDENGAEIWKFDSTGLGQELELLHTIHNIPFPIKKLEEE